MIIGITGGSGTGKSYVAKVFGEYGFNIIDADLVAKEVMLYDEGLKARIKEYFGAEFFDEDGFVLRRKLGERVFKNKKELELLSSWTHPEINKKIIESAKNFKLQKANAVLDVPLLIGSPIMDVCDITVSVIADDDLRIKRITQRDGIDETTAKNRIKSQLTNDEYVKNTDFVIYNNGESIKNQVLEILNKYDCID